MPNAFDFSASPFDCLDAAEQQIVRDSVDIAYFRHDETILAPGIEPSHLFVAHQGPRRAVRSATSWSPPTGPSDCFDGRSLVIGPRQQPLRRRRGGGGLPACARPRSTR